MTSPALRTTAYMAHTRSSSIDLSPSISSVLGSPRSSFPFPTQGSPMSPGWTIQSPPLMFAVETTPIPNGFDPSKRRASRYHKAARYLESSYLRRIELELVVQAVASLLCALLYLYLYMPSTSSLSPLPSRPPGPAAEPLPRQPTAPILSFIPTPTTTPAAILALTTYLSLLLAFRTGVHRIALSLDPVSGEDNLQGGQGLAVQLVTLGAAIAMIYIPLLVMMRFPAMLGVIAWSFTALVVAAVLYDAIRRVSNLEKSCNDELAGLGDKELGGGV